MKSQQLRVKALLVFLLCLPIFLFGQSFTVINSSDLDQEDVLISIPWEQISSKYGSQQVGGFKIVSKDGAKEYPFQLEYKGLPTIQNLLIQVSVKAISSLELKMVKGKPAPFAAKTFARYVPERLDDFAWENDKIAFRTYGKALEGTKGDAYGFDVWSKRTNDLIIDRRYKHGDYHNDLGDGLDYYHVGLTLGAGNIAPIIGDKIMYSKNYHRYKILDNGPLRTSFTLEYDPWDVGDMSVSATKTISIDAGSQMNKIVVDYTFEENKTLPVVVGIIKRPESGHIQLNEQEGITTYWEPVHGKDGTTGVAVILNSPVKGTSITKDQILTHAEFTKGEPFIYYMGAAWDKAGDITNANEWKAYVDKFKKQVPLKVELN